MTSEEKDKLYNEAVGALWRKSDDGKIQALIDKGLEIDRLDEYGRSLAARAMFAIINFDALYALWEAKASPTTEYVQEIFDAFESGKTAADFYAIEEAKSQLKKAKEISKDFSAKKLKIDSASFEMTEEMENEQDAEVVLRIKLKPFMFDGYFTETELEFIAFSNEEMKAAIFSEKGYTFKEDEMEGASIYIQSAHNPIDLKKLSIKEGRKFLKVSASLFFDFEYEQTDFKNEELVWEFKIEKG